MRVEADSVGSLKCFIYREVGAYSFFFNDTATTAIYTLSLHDALPILFFCFQRPRTRLPLLWAFFVAFTQKHENKLCQFPGLIPHHICHLRAIPRLPRRVLSLDCFRQD